MLTFYSETKDMYVILKVIKSYQSHAINRWLTMKMFTRFM